MLFVSVENISAGGQIGHVQVIDVANGPGEVTKIITFGETGKLLNIVQPHIDQTPHAGAFQPVKERLSGFLRKADGIDFHPVTLASTVVAGAFVGRDTLFLATVNIVQQIFARVEHVLFRHVKQLRQAGHGHVVAFQAAVS